MSYSIPLRDEVSLMRPGNLRDHCATYDEGCVRDAIFGECVKDTWDVVREPVENARQLCYDVDSLTRYIEINPNARWAYGENLAPSDQAKREIGRRHVKDVLSFVDGETLLRVNRRDVRNQLELYNTSDLTSPAEVLPHLEGEVILEASAKSFGIIAVHPARNYVHVFTKEDKWEVQKVVFSGNARIVSAQWLRDGRLLVVRSDGSLVEHSSKDSPLARLGRTLELEDAVISADGTVLGTTTEGRAVLYHEKRSYVLNDLFPVLSTSLNGDHCVIVGRPANLDWPNFPVASVYYLPDNLLRRVYKAEHGSKFSPVGPSPHAELSADGSLLLTRFGDRVDVTRSSDGQTETFAFSIASMTSQPCLHPGGAMFAVVAQGKIQTKDIRKHEVRSARKRLVF